MSLSPFIQRKHLHNVTKTEPPATEVKAARDAICEMSMYTIVHLEDHADLATALDHVVNFAHLFAKVQKLAQAVEASLARESIKYQASIVGNRAAALNGRKIDREAVLELLGLHSSAKQSPLVEFLSYKSVSESDAARDLVGPC